MCAELKKIANIIWKFEKEEKKLNKNSLQLIKKGNLDMLIGVSSTPKRWPGPSGNYTVPLIVGVAIT